MACVIITIISLVIFSHKVTIDVFFIGLALIFILLSLVVTLPRVARGARGYSLTSALMCDFNGIILIFLVIINFWSCLLAQSSIGIPGHPGLQSLLSLLACTTMLFFVERSWFKFYIYFEFSLIPIFLIIIGWGYQFERLKASKAIILYTVLASLPLLATIMLAGNQGGERIFQASLLYFREKQLTFFALFFVTAFLVKLPLLYVHIWLPKAHVEAPVVGSMFLAAVLLKLGGFGLLKLAPLLENSKELSLVLTRIAAWSLVIVRALCTQCTDIKVLIAFSSVAHMALAVLTILSGSNLSIGCSLLVLLSHGISSSIAFYFRFLFYKKSNTRRILLNKRVRGSLGVTIAFWGICCLGVIGAPPTFNLWVEINSFISVVVESLYLRKFLFWGALLTGAYSLLLVSVPLSFNSQFKFVNKSILEGLDKIHLFHSATLLVSLVVLAPRVLI